MKLTTKRFFYLLVGVMAALILLIGGTAYLGKQHLNKKTATLNDLKLKTSSLVEQEKALIQAKKDLEKFSELEDIASSIVPRDKDQARTVREIVQFAQESGVGLASISFPASKLGDKPTVVPGTDSQAPQPLTTSTSKNTSQIEAVKDIPGLFHLEAVVQSSGSPVPYDSFITFLSKLEKSRRTAQVTSITVEPDTVRRDLVTFSLIISVFIKP